MTNSVLFSQHQLQHSRRVLLTDFCYLCPCQPGEVVLLSVARNGSHSAFRGGVANIIRLRPEK